MSISPYTFASFAVTVQVPAVILRVSPAFGKTDPSHFVLSLKLPGPVNVLSAIITVYLYNLNWKIIVLFLLY